MNDQETKKLFYDLIWPHRSAVLRVSLILCRNSADAEDLAQETMMKAFKAIASFRQGSRVEAWLMTILRNARIDRLRSGVASKENVSLEQIEVDPPDKAPDVHPGFDEWTSPQEILNAFSDQQVIDALGRLPEEIRWTLLLVDVEGWDQSDAAELLGIPVGTIKSRAHRGRAMLREALEPVAREMRLL